MFVVLFASGVLFFVRFTTRMGARLLTFAASLMRTSFTFAGAPLVDTLLLLLRLYMPVSYTHLTLPTIYSV